MTTSKFPGTAGVSQLALADIGGEMAGIPFNEWTANGATTAVAVAPFALVVNEAIDASVPASGFLTTANNEVLAYSSYNAGTKTFTISARTQDGTVAGTIDNGSAIGQWLTRGMWRQLWAEIIAMQTEMFKDARPNLVLNSDFSRRTVFGLAMPEVFADLSGTTKIDAGAAGSVGSNIFTQGAANNEYAWCAGSFVWRDGRASATFKATAIAGIYRVKWRIDATNEIGVQNNNGNFQIIKIVAGVPTTVSTVANVLTINKWYWLELEKQGTTIVARIYDSGGTVPGVTKASSSEVTAARLTGTVSDAGVNVGAHVAITSDQAAAQWGGIATGNGGVYVETWLPESWGFASSVHGGTLGGQAIGFDESADSGPLAKQWAMRSYIPAQDRTITLVQDTPDGSQGPSLAWCDSFYFKTSGKAGANNMVRFTVTEANSALTLGTTHALADAGETAWTRSTTTYTGASTQRRSRLNIFINPTGGGGATTGTAYFMLPQLEQGSAATAWRNAPEDVGDQKWLLTKTANTTIASAVFAEADSRDYAGNFFLPRDSTVTMEFTGDWWNSAAGNLNAIEFTVDTVATSPIADTFQGITSNQPVTYRKTQRLAAGKHRIAVLWRATAGTGTIEGAPTEFTVTASVGK